MQHGPFLMGLVRISALVVSGALSPSCGERLENAAEQQTVVDWSPSSRPEDIADRDRDLGRTALWSGDCGATVFERDEAGAEVPVGPDLYAAHFGSLEGLRCGLAVYRDRLAGLPAQGGDDYESVITARSFYELAYRADLRGVDIEDELTAVCDAWKWLIFPDLVERVARRSFADAAEAGVLSADDLAAAKARDASRPTCSERLVAQGIPRE